MEPDLHFDIWFVSDENSCRRVLREMLDGLGRGGHKKSPGVESQCLRLVLRNPSRSFSETPLARCQTPSRSF